MTNAALAVPLIRPRNVYVDIPDCMAVCPTRANNCVVVETHSIV